MSEHLGEIAIAKVLRYINDPFYKIEAELQTGSAPKKRIYVAHRGNPDFQNPDIIVRLCFPCHNKTNLNLEDISCAGYFITSKIPDDFKYSSTNETILYGIWQSRMKKGHKSPIMGSVSTYYNPGAMAVFLHYFINEEFIIPYTISKRLRTLIRSSDSGHVKNVGGALRKYLSKMQRKYPDFPKVITIDEGINFHKRILPEFLKTDLYILEMEPQQ